MQSLQLSGSQLELKEFAAAHRLKECELKRERVAVLAGLAQGDQATLRLLLSLLLLLLLGFRTRLTAPKLARS